MSIQTTAHKCAVSKSFPGENVSDPRYLRFLYALIEGEIAWENVGEEDRKAAQELHSRIFPPAVVAKAATA